MENDIVKLYKRDYNKFRIVYIYNNVGIYENIIFIVWGITDE